MKLFPGIIAVPLFLASLSLQAQDTVARPEGYIFTVENQLKTTPVKNQYRSGTCWSFATVSFVETELLRMGKPEMDLSEMFYVRNAYQKKSERYVRMHGSSNFGPGGQAHDVMNIIATHGLVPENDYPGLLKGETQHVHGELDAGLQGYLDAVVRVKSGKLSQVWPEAVSALLDTYLGKLPEKLSVKGNPTPLEYAKSEGFNPDDYVEITSYTHHPFYTAFALEIPDNWSNDTYYNVPMDDLYRIMLFALDKGYSFCWDGDVSERGFSHGKGVAIVPEKNIESLEGTERSRWEKLSDKDKQAELYSFDKPGYEKIITPEMRQQAFDNHQATDDHLMHITGLVTDQNGTNYFITKNSWADNSNDKGGYLNMSEAYVKLNTLAILVHKNAVPADIRKKAGF
ncbi:MAG: C1 family peptidase [Lentimicrobium sp.]|jgi:bleomycin hydrolase|nr:C1 family peptidase [Lentimicrobium sp.]